MISLYKLDDKGKKSTRLGNFTDLTKAREAERKIKGNWLSVGGGVAPKGTAKS